MCMVYPYIARASIFVTSMPPLAAAVCQEPVGASTNGAAVVGTQAEDKTMAATMWMRMDSGAGCSPSTLTTATGPATSQSRLGIWSPRGTRTGRLEGEAVAWHSEWASP